MCISIYIYVCYVYICIYICIYIYVYHSVRTSVGSTGLACSALGFGFGGLGNFVVGFRIRSLLFFML